ncbi:MAG: hypothetical protein MJZ04_08405 [Bacteroidales bacterium]|nr:hypothetical protein [Bacteroidales bacterium]
MAAALAAFGFVDDRLIGSFVARYFGCYTADLFYLAGLSGQKQVFLAARFFRLAVLVASQFGLFGCFVSLGCSAALRLGLLCSFAGQSCCNPDSKIAIFRHSTTPQFFCCATVGGSFRRESPDMQLFLAQHTVSAVKSA